MKIKLCGIRRKEDVEFVNRYCPDYIGFIFAESPRQVSLAQAKELKNLLDPQIKAVGVFVNEPIEQLKTIVKEAGLDAIQLHGDEDADYIAEAKALGVPVWKAVRVQSKADIETAQQKGADMLLLDSFTKGTYGGTGKIANWDRIEHAKIEQPFFLAGGLNIENVEEAVLRLHPYGVDISGGIETNGVKDKAKIRELMGVLKRL